MRYTPNNEDLPINPAEKQLMTLFGSMVAVTGNEVPESFKRRLDYLNDPDGHPLQPPEPHYEVEEFPGLLARIRLGSLAVLKAINPANRAERAEQRAEMLERRLDVATFIALRLLQPRISGTKGEKISWIGTNSMMDPTDTTKHPSPNWYRPSTRSEIAANRRLERTKDRIRASRNNIEHLERTYTRESTSVAWGRDLLQTGAPKSREERKNMRKVSGDLNNNEKRATRIERKFENIANAQDVRGKVARWRLRRANKISSRTTPGNEPWKERRARRINGRVTPRNEPLVEINVEGLRSTSTPPNVRR